MLMEAHQQSSVKQHRMDLYVRVSSWWMNFYDFGASSQKKKIREEK
jgi:hypothetical protein